MSEPIIYTTPKGIQLRILDPMDEQGYKNLSDLLEGFPDGIITTDSAVEIRALPEGFNVLLVSAPGLSAVDLKALSEHASQFLSNPDRCVITNYQVTITGRLSHE